MLVLSSGSVLSAASVVAADKEEFDPNTVTPGVVGFIVTFLVMVVVLLLVLDMVRRIRRVNYRAQVREQLDAEEREGELDDAEADGQPTDASGEAYDQEVGEAPDEPPTGR